MASISQQMAQFACGLKYDDIPTASIHEAKRFLLDSIGCALAATKHEDMLAMQRFIAKLGGTPEATLIGSGIKTNAPNAALFNNMLIRALDYNDIYWERDPCHPSDLIGTALAVGEANHKTGSDVIAAIILAYELAMRWCHAAEPGVRDVGWHHSSLTQFVSPLVAGYLYDLTPDQMTAAVGISGSSHFTLGGVVAGQLTQMKNTADPLAAQAGVYAALMAREGVTGPVEVIEGKEGLFKVINQVSWHPEELTRDLGREFIITRCGYKAFPTEALTHQPITAALQICTEHHILAEDIAQIRVETTRRGADILADPSKYHPLTKDTADHSLPYVIAVAVADGNVLLNSFSDKKLYDPRIRSLLDKILVVVSPEIDALFPRIKRTRVTICTLRGETFSAQVDDAKGTPQNPMADAEIITKFRENARVMFEEALYSKQQDRLISAVWDFERYEDIKGFMQLLVRDLFT